MSYAKPIVFFIASMLIYLPQAHPSMPEMPGVDEEESPTHSMTDINEVFSKISGIASQKAETDARLHATSAAAAKVIKAKGDSIQGTANTMTRAAGEIGMGGGMNSTDENSSEDSESDATSNDPTMSLEEVYALIKKIFSHLETLNDSPELEDFVDAVAKKEQIENSTGQEAPPVTDDPDIQDLVDDTPEDDQDEQDLTTYAQDVSSDTDNGAFPEDPNISEDDMMNTTEQDYVIPEDTTYDSSNLEMDTMDTVDLETEPSE